MKVDIKKLLSQKNITRAVLIGVIILLLGAAFFDLFYQPALTYLTEVSKQGLTYLGAVAGIKVVTAMFSLSEGVDQIVTRILNFFIFTNALLFGQLVLLKLSKLMLIKAALVICFTLSILLKPYRALLIRVLFLLFLINPGISLYVLSIKYIADQAKLDISNSINEKLTEIDEIASTGFLPAEEQTAPEEVYDSGENEGAEEDKKSFFTQFKEKISSITEKTKEKIKEVSTFGTQKARELAERIEELLFSVIQYFVTIVIQYLLLPLLYFYGFYTFFKKIAARLDSGFTRLLVPEKNKAPLIKKEPGSSQDTKGL